MSDSHYSSGYVITDQSYAIEELGSSSLEEARDVSSYMSNMRLNSPMTIPSQLSQQAGMIGNGYPSQYSPNFQPIIQSNANSVVKPNTSAGNIQHKQQQTMMSAQRQRSSSANGPSSPPQSLQQLQQQVDHKKQQHDLQMSFKVKIDKKPPPGQRPAKLDPESLQDKLTLGEDNPELILEQATISELKDLLRSRGLPTTGKKSVLLERLKTPNSSQRITPLKLNSSSSNPSPSSSPRMRNTSLTSPRYSPYTSIGLSPRTVVTSNPDLPGTRHIAALNLDSPVSREPVNSYRRDDPRFLIRNSSRQAFFNAYESALQEQPELDIQLPSNDTMIPIGYSDDWSRQDPTLISMPKTQSPISKLHEDPQTMAYYSVISDNQMDQPWYDVNSNGYYRNNT